MIPAAHILSPKLIGSHVSIAKGVSNAIGNAILSGCTAFAMFPRSPRVWRVSPLPEKEVQKWNELLDTKIESENAEVSFQFSTKNILPHGSYLVNLGHNEIEKREKSLDLFKAELSICSRLGIEMFNIHPGSTRKEISREECIHNIATCINKAIEEIPKVRVVLENTAGGGGTIGTSFEELHQIISLVEDKTRVGICLDTCHMFAAGYDISSKERFTDVMDQFDSIVGLPYLSAMHINDSKVDCGSNLDRHESLGKGKIGLDAFRFLMKDDRFNNMPLILETPGDEMAHKREIELLHSFE